MNQQRPVPIQLKTFDVDSAKTYLRGVESLVREALVSDDPRVCVIVLRLLSMPQRELPVLLEGASQWR